MSNQVLKSQMSKWGTWMEILRFTLNQLSPQFGEYELALSLSPTLSLCFSHTHTSSHPTSPLETMETSLTQFTKAIKKKTSRI